MSLFLFSYIVNFILLGALGITFFKSYKNLSSVYFLIFCFGTGAWFILYLLTYFGSDSHNTLILFAQLSYATSLVALYSFILFLYFFPSRKKKIFHWSLISFLCISLVLYVIYTHTTYIVEGLYFHDGKQDWYEIEGRGFIYHIAASLMFIPLSVIIGWNSFKKLYFIEKKRLQYMVVGMIGFVVLAFFFLLILPSFGLWTMEKYIGLFFLPFVASVFYVIRRYDFLKIKIISLKIFILLYSITTTFLILIIIREYGGIYFSQDFKKFWQLSDNGLFFDIISAIFLYIGISSLLKSRLLSMSGKDGFSKAIDVMKTQIPFILSMEELNFYLKKEFKNHLDIHGAKIGLHVDDKIKDFFINNQGIKYILNDTIFFEENKTIFHKDILTSGSYGYLIFPIFSESGDIQGLLEIGRKSFNDPFFTGEINELIQFREFLRGHLKYLGIYREIQDLTINLDKRVDEKTIEYNTLLSKQKEFIRYIGHEIKNPITNCIFLSEGFKSISKNTDLSEMQEDGNILYDELVKVSRLIKNIFSTEQIDLKKMSLYKQKINIGDFIHNEVRVYESSFPSIGFNTQIDNNLPVKELDEVQFRQVIHNLLTNACKFSNTKKAVINIKVYPYKKHSIKIEIEDNGPGFKDIEITSIFDKYTTGGGNTKGLGLGLYLCKKIIELHGGDISLKQSSKLGGALFSITL